MTPLRCFVISLLASAISAEMLGLGCTSTAADMTFLLRKTLRDEHNHHRSTIASGQRLPDKNIRIANMHKLKYSCELEASAHEWAQKCTANRDVNSHFGLLSTSLPDVSSVRNVTVKVLQETIAKWYNNGLQAFPSDFGANSEFKVQSKYYTDANANKKGPMMDFVKFFQVAYGQLTELGCALNYCEKETSYPNRVILVCRYFAQIITDFDANGAEQGTRRNGQPLVGEPLFVEGVPCIYDHQCATFKNSSCSSFEYMCCADRRCSAYEKYTDPLYDQTKTKTAAKIVLKSVLGIVGVLLAFWI